MFAGFNGRLLERIGRYVLGGGLSSFVGGRFLNTIRCPCQAHVSHEL